MCEAPDDNDDPLVNDVLGVPEEPPEDGGLLEDLARSITEDCPECQYCGGRITEPCKFLLREPGPQEQCVMHQRINRAREDIRILTEECSDVWIPKMELDNLNNHRTRLQMVLKRKNGEPWQGSKKPEDLYVDVDDVFRPIDAPKFHPVPDRSEPCNATPTDSDVGIKLLDKSLHDITGMLYETSHFLTHDADRLTRNNTPCWTCTRAATRQQRKYSEVFRKNLIRYQHRNVHNSGDQITGDYAVMSDLHGRGGVHGARNLYTQKDLGTGRIDAYPTSKQDDEQTTAAMKHIIGDLPRRSYYSDNQRCLRNGARACGMTTECSLQGISQTNAIVEANNKTILSGIRKLLCQAGLPAVWWTSAASCFCFLKSAMIDTNNESAYFRTHGSHFPGKMIPFGCHVFFVPSPTKDTRAKTAQRMCQGIFLGYRTAPGGKWAGDYLVADLNDFAGLPLHATVEPGVFRNVRPHVKRTVNWTPG